MSRYHNFFFINLMNMMQRELLFFLKSDNFIYDKLKLISLLKTIYFPYNLSLCFISLYYFCSMFIFFWVTILFYFSTISLTYLFKSCLPILVNYLAAGILMCFYTDSLWKDCCGIYFESSLRIVINFFLLV